MKKNSFLPVPNPKRTFQDAVTFQGGRVFFHPRFFGCPLCCSATGQASHENKSALALIPRHMCSCTSTWNRVAGLPRSGRFDYLTEPGIVHQSVAGLFAEKPCSYGATA